MLKKFFVVFIVLSILAGCNNSSEFDSRVEEGKEAITEAEYDRALLLFKSALEEKSDDKEVKVLIAQTEKMIEAINGFHEEEANNIEDIIALFEEVENTEGGYSILSEQAEGWREDLVKREEEIEKYNRKLNESKALKDNGDYDEAGELLDRIISDIENVKYLEEQQDRAIEILTDVYNRQLDKANMLKDSGNYDEARELLDTIISNTGNVEYLEEQNEKATKMSTEIEDAIDE